MWCAAKGYCFEASFWYVCGMSLMDVTLAVAKMSPAVMQFFVAMDFY
jgi:hypothetical protein